MRTINKIIVHCSDSNWGNAAIIDEWHRARGWKSGGYHFVILNGNILSSSYEAEFDGVLEEGRSVEQAGAHVKGMNLDTIGICLIGKEKFSSKQFKKLNRLLYYLCTKYDLSISDILGHCETPTGAAQGKTCPNIKMISYRNIRLRLFFMMMGWAFIQPEDLQSLLG